MSTSETPNGPPSWSIPQDLRLRLLAALSGRPDARPQLTYEEFLDWADEDTLAEWVNGEVVMASPASDRHQDLVNFLVVVLKGFVKLHDLGKVQSAPFQMRLAQSGREPDLFFVARAHLDRLKNTYLDGPADLAVEIVSPESIGRDRGDKFREYEQAGIPEYWLLDPGTQRAEFYRLDARGAYQLVPLDAGGVYHSAVLPDFWLRVEWLWEELPPATNTILLDICGDAYARQMLEELRRGGFLREGE